jgi:hypothetical protein
MDNGYLACSGALAGLADAAGGHRSMRGVAAGGQIVCAIDTHGLVYCHSEAGPAAPPPNEMFDDFAVSDISACGIRSANGTLACWSPLGANPVVTTTSQFSVIAMSNFAVCGISLDRLQLHCNSLTDGAHKKTVSVALVGMRLQLVTLSVSDFIICVTTAVGSLLCAMTTPFLSGHTRLVEQSTYLRNEDDTSTNMPIFVDVDVSNSHYCAQRDTGELVCDSVCVKDCVLLFFQPPPEKEPGTSFKIPKNLQGELNVPASMRFLTFTAAASCGITVDHSMECWGDMRAVFLPRVSLFRSVAVAPTLACGISAQRQLRCWGAHANAILTPNFNELVVHVDVGFANNSPNPSRSNVCYIVADADGDGPGSITCAIFEGPLYSGRGKLVEAAAPPTFDSVIVSVHVAGQTACALAVDGTFKCWMLAAAAADNSIVSNAPIEVRLKAIDLVDGRDRFSPPRACGLKLDDGSFVCWPAQAGFLLTSVKEKIFSSAPKPFGFTHVSMSLEVTCGITDTDRRVLCSSSNLLEKLNACSGIGVCTDFLDWGIVVSLGSAASKLKVNGHVVCVQRGTPSVERGMSEHMIDCVTLSGVSSLLLSEKQDVVVDSFPEGARLDFFSLVVDRPTGQEDSSVIWACAIFSDADLLGRHARLVDTGNTVCWMTGPDYGLYTVAEKSRFGVLPREAPRVWTTPLGTYLSGRRRRACPSGIVSTTPGAATTMCNGFCRRGETSRTAGVCMSCQPGQWCGVDYLPALYLKLNSTEARYYMFESKAHACVAGTFQADSASTSCVDCPVGQVGSIAHVTFVNHYMPLPLQT